MYLCILCFWRVTEIDLYEVQRDTYIVSSLYILGQLNKEGSAADLLYPLCISFLTVLQNGNNKKCVQPHPPHNFCHMRDLLFLC
jgi:hypothetical protein